VGRPGAIHRQGCTRYPLNIDPNGCGVGGPGAAETHPDVDNDSVLVAIGTGRVVIGSGLTDALLV
jgi:hypothetical protein